MPRQPRFCPAHYPIHVIQRGVNRAVCFTCDADMAAYASSLRDGAARHDVAIHAWVMMSNHIHLLLTPSCEDGVSRLMRHIGRHYVQPFNFKYSRTGPLFEGRFKSTIVQNTFYLLNCIRYIELNPVRAGLTVDPGDYVWSSYRCHAFGQRVRHWTPHSEYLALGKDQLECENRYREFVRGSMSAEVIQKIRHCSNTGLVLGTQDFRDQVMTLRR